MATRETYEYDALMLTGHADLSPVKLNYGNRIPPTDFAQSVFEALGGWSAVVEHLDHDIELWHNPKAAEGKDPVMNHGAMWLCQMLRGPSGVPVLYGDVLFTGRAGDGTPMPLSLMMIRMFQRVLTGELLGFSPPPFASASPEED